MVGHLLKSRSKPSEEHNGTLTTSLRSGRIQNLPIRQSDDSENGHHPNHALAEETLLEKQAKEKDEKKLAPHVALMKPILRFLQLLCENHNRDLQVLDSILHPNVPDNSIIWTGVLGTEVLYK